LDLVVEFSSMSPSTPERASSISRNLRTFSRRLDLVEISAVRNAYLRREI
jgi:hypothetical protein